MKDRKISIVAEHGWIDENRKVERGSLSPTCDRSLHGLTTRRHVACVDPQAGQVTDGLRICPRSTSWCQRV